MTYDLWSGLDNVRDILRDAWDADALGRADVTLDAVMETIAEILPAASNELLEQGTLAARELLFGSLKNAGADLRSISYLAGRVSAIVDVLGHASRHTVDEAMVELARRAPYADVLVQLAERPLRNVDLAERLGKDKARISKILELLRSTGTVISQKNGREAVNALTPLGRSVVEEGIQQRQRGSLEQAAVHDLPSAVDFKLGRLHPDFAANDEVRFPTLHAAFAR